MQDVKFDFESLDLYKKSLDFIDWVYLKTKDFPKDELYNLSSQFRRASTSMALNLSEGYGETFPLFLRHYKIFKGSLRECVVCSEIAYRQNYFSSEDKLFSRNKLAELSKMIVGLKKYFEIKEKNK